MQSKTKAKCLIGAALFMVFCGAAAPVWAGEVEDMLKDALQSYKSGNLTEAAEGLDDAAQMVRQQKGKMMEPFLPKALPGWEDGGNSTPPITHAALAATSFIKDDAVIQIYFVADPRNDEAMQMRYFAEQGGRLVRIGKQRAMVTYDARGQQGQVVVTVARQVLVVVRGENAGQEDIMSYAKAIDYEKLGALK